MKKTATINVVSSICLMLLMAVAPALAEEGATFLEHELAIGYRAVSSDDNPDRAGEYDSLRSSATGSVAIQAAREQRHAFLDIDFLNEEDFDGELDLNYKGLLRLNLLGSSLFHNLDHLPYDPALPESRQPAGTVLDFVERNPGANYGVQVEQYGADFRGKHPEYPAHLNVTYWRLERSGDQQLRYAQEGSPCGTCHAVSQSRSVDRVTEEVTAGFDSHIGPIDLIYEFLVREFRDRDPIPKDSFALGINGQRLAGDWQHDELPDSRLYSHTIKAHTSLSGGLVAATSYTIGARENRSELQDVVGVKAETDLQKFAGDLTWIVSDKLTVNARYRYLDLDSDNSDSLTSNSLVNIFVDPNTPAPVQVKDSIDLIRVNSELAVTYRPSRKISFKGEYKREDIHRSNTGAPVRARLFGNINIDPVWELPEDEVINRYKLSLYHRPYAKGRLWLRGHLQYQTSNDPAYGTAIEEGYQAFASINWTPTARFGLLTNLRAERTDSEHTLVQFDPNNIPVGTPRDRETQSENLTAGIWYNPVERASITLNYGYLRSRILEDVIIGNVPDPTNGTFVNPPWILAENTEFAQRVQTVNLGLQWRIVDTLKALGEARYIRSYSAFDPQFAATVDYSIGTTDVDSSELRQISKVDIRQSGGTLGLEWRPEKSLTCSTTYTYDRYDDLDQELFDGSVQTYMASISKSW